MELKTFAILRRSGSEKFAWTRGSSSPGWTALMVDSNSRIGLNASRRITKLATRIAARPIASRPSRKGSRERPEKFSVISGPLTAPAAMITLFATTTFWKVVRFRCHHRGSNEGLTAHFRHRFEAVCARDLGSVMPWRIQVFTRCQLALCRPGIGYRYRCNTAPSPLFSGPLPQRPAFFCQPGSRGYLSSPGDRKIAETNGGQFPVPVKHPRDRAPEQCRPPLNGLVGDQRRQIGEARTRRRDRWLLGQPHFVAAGRLPNLEYQEFPRPVRHLQGFLILAPWIPGVLESHRHRRFRGRGPVEVENGALDGAHERAHVCIAMRVRRQAAFADEFGR